MAPLRCVARAVLVLALLVAFAGAPARAADETLAEAQNILLMLGYKPGKSDGNTRPQTAQALSDFQRANKLPVTGKLTDDTMATLRHIRDSKFTGSLTAPKPGQQPRKLQVEPKPQAQPVDQVAAAPVENAPGTRVLGAGSNLASATSIPPALFGGGSSSSAPTTSPNSMLAPTAAAPDRQPFLGIASWNWILPFLGIPLFGFLWWYGMRRQAGVPESETAELMEARREPNMNRGSAPAAGRREPTL